MEIVSSCNSETDRYHKQHELSRDGSWDLPATEGEEK